MASVSLLAKRFSELATQIDSVDATKRFEHVGIVQGERVDNDLLLNWRVKARSLISLACGKDSEHYATFERFEKPQVATTNYGMMKSLKAIFLAAKEDYEGGYLKSVRNLVQAEVFDNELEQAGELLAANYKLP